MLRLLIFLSLSLGLAAQERDLTAVALLDEVLAEPVDYDPREQPNRHWGSMRISRERFTLLRPRRRGVVHELRLRLDSLAPFCADSSEFFRPLETYSGIIIDLNASELLPELLRVEKKLRSNTAKEAAAQERQLLSVISQLLTSEGTKIPKRIERDQVVKLAHQLVASGRRLRGELGMRKVPKDW